MNAPLRAWIHDTCTTVADPADLDAVLDRTGRGDISLVSEDGARSLFISLGGDRSTLV